MLVFIVPVPPAVLDLLQAVNITLAVLVLLTTLAIRSPGDFSAFPTILLTTTLTRLVLNVATTRLVLTHGGTQGLDAAGGVVRSFGEFVAGDQVLVGAILFGILVVIQFVVITGGPLGSARSPPGSCSTACPGGRWRSTRTSTPA